MNNNKLNIPVIKSHTNNIYYNPDSNNYIRHHKFYYWKYDEICRYINHLNYGFLINKSYKQNENKYNQR